MIAHKDNLFRRWKSNQSNAIHRVEYNRYRNKTNKAICQAKNTYNKKLIIEAGRDTKKIWGYINNWLGREKKSIDDTILKYLGKQFDVPTICEKFSETFCNEIEKIKHKCNICFLERNSYAQEQNKSMRFQKVTSSSVELVINRLNEKKSAGIDNIRMRDIKLIKDKFSPILAHFINLSVYSQAYPDLLKLSIIRPLFKGGSHYNTGDYRPIAVLPSLNKIVERTIVNQVSKFLNNHNVITPAQFGFQQGKNTEKLLSKFANNINNYLNEQKVVAVLFIDFRKAFDTLDHSTLLNALNESGIRGHLLGWFADYLKNRSLTVKVAEFKSTNRHCKYGVAQGSVTGPVCYILHVNSMISVIKECKKYMFADDTCLMYAGKDAISIEKHLQDDFDNVTKWAHDNGIILNTEKTKLLLIKSSYRKQDVTEIKIKGHSYECLHSNMLSCSCLEIENVVKFRYLGLVVDNRFCWKYHIISICDKLKVLLSKFKSLSYCTPTSTMYMLYNSLVESILSYGLECYGLTFKTDINKIKELQIRFIKVIENKKIKKQLDKDYSKILEKSSLLPIDKKCLMLLAVNEHCNDEYKIKAINKYNTRKNALGHFVVPKVSNFYGKRTKEWIIPKIFNCIPKDITHFHGPKIALRNMIKDYLLSNEIII
ncbi:hypothetical protein JYU34_017232 [Plutella xylostella]|uniref:Reverse transcriptase domain-containing protein n=1 Tax=Plutella xylostella TaxID=51655 RepID=A0ABQ7Q0N7_PLUXY|nr:hypothetical protein JYU34_017232 [Plutella xylostella]